MQPVDLSVTPRIKRANHLQVSRCEHGQVHHSQAIIRPGADGVSLGFQLARQRFVPGPSFTVQFYLCSPTLLDRWTSVACASRSTPRTRSLAGKIRDHFPSIVCAEKCLQSNIQLVLPSVPQTKLWQLIHFISLAFHSLDRLALRPIKEALVATGCCYFFSLVPRYADPTQQNYEERRKEAEKRGQIT